MISSEVQRTLVKSPPELWAEISDPESLARHLGEFGDIRITRVEPEQRVDWQSGEASGSVVIKPSGWGTKVKLTVTRELAEPPATPADEVEAPAALQPRPEPEPEPEPLEPAAEAEVEVEADLEPEPTALAEDQPEYEDEEFEDEEFELEGDDAPDALVQDDFADDFAEQQPAPQPRRGFFARLFSRRRRASEPEHTELDAPSQTEIDDATDQADDRETAPAPQPYNALAVWASQLDSSDDGDEDSLDDHGDDEAHEYAAEAFTQPQAEAAPDSSPAGELAAPHAMATARDGGDDTPEDAQGDDDAPPDIAAELGAAEQVAAEEVTAVLTGVLDRLGSAHHRPFSRA